MTNDEHKQRLLNDLDFFLATTRTMQAFGGSFATKIAEAAVIADSNNRAALVQAFLHLFQRYDPRLWVTTGQE